MVLNFRKARKFTRLQLVYFPALSKSLATSLVHGSRNPARKIFGIPLRKYIHNVRLLQMLVHSHLVVMEDQVC